MILPAIGIQIKSLLPKNDEAKLLIDWLEIGVFDALKQKYVSILWKKTAPKIFEKKNVPGEKERDGSEGERKIFFYTNAPPILPS